MRRVIRLRAMAPVNLPSASITLRVIRRRKKKSAVSGRLHLMLVSQAMRLLRLLTRGLQKRSDFTIRLISALCPTSHPVVLLLSMHSGDLWYHRKIPFRVWTHLHQKRKQR